MSFHLTDQKTNAKKFEMAINFKICVTKFCIILNIFVTVEVRTLEFEKIKRNPFRCVLVEMNSFKNVKTFL